MEVEFILKDFMATDPTEVSLNEIAWAAYAYGFRNIVWHNGYLMAFPSSIDSFIDIVGDKIVVAHFGYVDTVLYTKIEYRRYLSYDPVKDEAKLVDRLPNVYDDKVKYTSIFPYAGHLIITIINRIKELEEKHD